jgi:GT2 family glycosyltransferase
MTQNETGDKCGKHFSGWCFMIRRSTWEQIKGFDEDFIFWFADNATIEQVKAIGIEPMLVPGSLVQHLGSTTLNRTSVAERDAFTWAQCDKFNNKYGKTVFHDNPTFQHWKSKQK